MKCFALMGLIGLIAAAGCGQKWRRLRRPGPVSADSRPGQTADHSPLAWLGRSCSGNGVDFDQQQTGMMFRTNLDENSGMIFPLPQNGAGRAFG